MRILAVVLFWIFIASTVASRGADKRRGRRRASRIEQLHSMMVSRRGVEQRKPIGAVSSKPKSSPKGD